jgi:hypothetical protein
MLCARYKRCAAAALCCLVLGITPSFATPSPQLENATIEFDYLRGLRDASVEFEYLRGLRHASVEFTHLRGLRNATIEFDLFSEGRRIEVFPDALDFGVVELGSSTSCMVTISNGGFAPLTVWELNLTGAAGFSLDAAPPLPVALTQGTSQDVTLVFAPQVEGPASGTLEIVSDDVETPIVVVELIGQGDDEPEPEEQIEEILEFIDDQVATGDLVGDGPGGSASGRLNALVNMIEAAGDLIATGDTEGASAQLQDALNRTDSEHPPPDFVAGPAAAELEVLLQGLISDLLGS